jgi:hypothetical protein
MQTAPIMHFPSIKPVGNGLPMIKPGVGNTLSVIKE